MANQEQIGNLVQHAVERFLLSDMAKERRIYQERHIKWFAFVECGFNQVCPRISKQEFVVYADGERFVVTVRKSNKKVRAL
jgi:hypothetical protein